MAITPKEALGNKLRIEQTAIDAFDKKIDEVLAREWDGRTPVKVETKGISDFVRQETVKRFTAKGWSVKFFPDQRGDFLTFTEYVSRDDRYDR